MTTCGETTYFFLPDTLANWPWPRMINPHYKEVSEASDAWFRTFNAFNEHSQLTFDKCKLGLLAALSLPFASKEHLRTGCDLMNLFFTIDEYTDVEPEHVVREIADVIIDVLNNPHKPRPEGEILLGQITKEFWELAIKTASPTSQKHFIDSFTDYLGSVVLQAADKDNDKLRTVDEYLEMRPSNIGLLLALVPAEMHLDIPDEVYFHPVISELRHYATLLVIFDNDLASYNKEQAYGDDKHNIVTIAVQQFQLDIDGAMAWVYEYHKDVQAKFFNALKTVPSFGREMDKKIMECLLNFANWPRCNDCWNFESGRYFGSKGLEIQKTRLVPLMPKVKVDRALKQRDVEIPLIDI